MNRYRVWLRSVPGPYAQYDGKVDVWADDPHEAKAAALRQLRRGTFPDRNDSMWHVERVEPLPGDAR